MPVFSSSFEQLPERDRSVVLPSGLYASPIFSFMPSTVHRHCPRRREKERKIDYPFGPKSRKKVFVRSVRIRAFSPPTSFGESNVAQLARSSLFFFLFLLPSVECDVHMRVGIVAITIVVPAAVCQLSRMNLPACDVTGKSRTRSSLHGSIGRPPLACHGRDGRRRTDGRRDGGLTEMKVVGQPRLRRHI